MAAFSGVAAVAVNVILPIFIIIGLGALYGRHFNPDTKVISTTIVYLFSPFLVINSIMNSTIENGEVLLIMGLALTLAVIMALLGFGVARVLRFDRGLESAFIMSIVMINGGNFGLPVNEFAYGAAGLQRAIIYYVTTSLIANTFGVFLASRGKASARESLTNIFKVPLVYGLIIGFILNLTDTTLPLPLERVVTLLSAATVPAMIALLGMRLVHTSIKGQVGPVLLAAGMRLLVAPVVMLLLITLAGASGVTRQVVITEAAMPTAVIAGVLAIQFDADADFVTATILTSTVIGLVTLSVVLTLLGVG